MASRSDFNWICRISIWKTETPHLGINQLDLRPVDIDQGTPMSIALDDLPRPLIATNPTVTLLTMT
jgi:hypothetical protein